MLRLGPRRHSTTLLTYLILVSIKFPTSISHCCLIFSRLYVRLPRTGESGFPQAFVKDHTLGIPAYKVLILNEIVTSLDGAAAVVRMAEAGLPVIIVGAVPGRSNPTNSTSQATLAIT